MTDTVNIPPIKIQGIKTKIIPYIKANLLIDASTYWIEPFMGSGVVGFNLAPKNAIFADINPHIINFYNAVKKEEITAEKARTFLEREGEQLAKYDGDHYYTVRNRFNDFRHPLDFLFLNRSCFNGMIRFNKDYNFNVPYGHKPNRFSKAYITKICNQIYRIQQLILKNNWSFICQSFEKTITEAPPHSFFYCDPPYIGRHVDYYDSWDIASENKLKTYLLQSEGNFMLSTWDSNKYRKNLFISEIWGFCHKINIEHFYHVGAKESNRNPMLEALLTNYIPLRQKTDNALSQQTIFDLINNK